MYTYSQSVTITVSLCFKKFLLLKFAMIIDRAGGITLFYSPKAKNFALAWHIWRGRQSEKAG
jgi:hypothetical protein